MPLPPSVHRRYLASLRDDREIYIYGDRVRTSPATPPSAATASMWLYDALHDPQSKEKLCWETDTGNGGYTHEFFRYARGADELRQRPTPSPVVAADLRLDGPHPGLQGRLRQRPRHQPGFYGRFEDNAKTWYKRVRKPACTPTVPSSTPDRPRQAGGPVRTCSSVDEEVDGGIVVSGARWSPRIPR